MPKVVRKWQSLNSSSDTGVWARTHQPALRPTEHVLGVGLARNIRHVL